MKLTLIFQAVFVLTLSSAVRGKTWLRADGTSDTYTLINEVLGGTAYEVPDCVHDVPHITQQTDAELNKPVFAFHVHLNEDNDRCQVFDRQRVEIKTYDPSPASLKGFNGETVTLSWNFKLDAGLQINYKFCHIHQIKAKGGNDGNPIINITPRKRLTKEYLQVQHTSNGWTTTTLVEDDLSKYVGTWIHAQEELTYGPNGKYSLVLTRLDNGEELMNFVSNDIDLWRDGTEYVRPKWGIYRSLGDTASLRDEDVYFSDFCLSKGTDDKCV